MSRTTIDFGIDLGTTNSSIAVFKGIDTEVFKNNENSECTPSAVWVDKGNSLIVGRRAKEQLEHDPDNAVCEFKVQMGSDWEMIFARGERRMKPEELSAEILKSLKQDVQHRFNDEEVGAAVITVPAAFELPQCEATQKAARLAGFASSPLLQEPVAAALAYGFQSGSDKVFWLVFDFGGGTFDAAVMQVRDGVIQVVNHGGDNHLGGKLIDWAIVDDLLIPSVTKERTLTDFRRGNPRWRGAIAKLKIAAEQAKIRLSRDQSAEITIDFLCQDDRKDAVRFEHELKRADVERLAESFFRRAINICKKVLAEKRLAPEHLEKVILVGGPTLTPFLRSLLTDRGKEGLGAPLEFAVDPLTVVARGAAIFAGTQRYEKNAVGPAPAGAFIVELEYKPVGFDTEPLMGGKVSPPGGESLSGFTIEFVHLQAQPQWRSGRIGLAPNGTFVTNLWAEKGRPNTYLIELCDSSGGKRQAIPDRVAYTVGLAISDQPLIHSLGVALANNQVATFFEKGSSLPARVRHFLRTAFDVRRGGGGDLIKIPVVEGNYKRADRNKEVGAITVSANEIKRDVPAGSEIEITIEIDQSRTTRAKAYIPILDEEFDKVIDLVNKKVDAEQLRRDVEVAKKRLNDARKKTEDINDATARSVMQRIDAERMLHDVETSLAASQVEPDGAFKCEKRLLDLQLALDEVEEALEWPALAAEAGKEIEVERNILNNSGFGITADEKAAFATLEREIRAAKGSRDADLLRRKVREMDRIGVSVMLRQPGWWVGQLDRLEKQKNAMTNQAQADDFISQGRRAINNNDVPGLQAAVRQLVALLPVDQQRMAGKGLGSTVL